MRAKKTGAAYSKNCGGAACAAHELKLMSSDGHPGLIAALELVWPRVALQRCWAQHICATWQANSNAASGNVLQGEKLIYQASTRREAIGQFRAWSNRWREQAERASSLETDLEELLAFYDYSTGTLETPTHHRMLIERLFVGSTTAHPHHVRLYHAPQL